MLSPDEIDSMLGTRGTTSDPPFTNLGEDPVHRTDYTFPPECKYTIHAGLASEYVDSGNTGVYGYHDIAPTPPAPANWKALTSTSLWCCSPPRAGGRVRHHLGAALARLRQSPGHRPGRWHSPRTAVEGGAVSNANGVLSTSVTVTVNGDGANVTMPCQRVLTARRNVVIDVDACRKDVGDLGVTIANQIGAKVDKQ